MLEEGMKFKSLKDVCEFMGWEYKTSSHSQEALKKKFNSICKTKKYGRFGFEVMEVYEESKPTLSSGLLKGDIQTLILDMLSRNDDQHIDLPIRRLMLELDLVNQSYINAYDFEGKYDNSDILTKYDKAIVKDCYKFIYDKGSKNIKEALNGLQDQALIDWQMKMKVARYDYVRMENGFLCQDEKGNPIRRKNLIYDYATEQERRYVAHAENKAMKEMSVSNKQFFNICHEARDKFRARCKQLLEEYDIHHYYYVYDIVYTREDVLESLKSRELTSTQKHLNSSFLNQIHETINYYAQKHYSKEVNELLDMGLYTEDDIIRLSKSIEKGIKMLPAYQGQAYKCSKRLVDRGQKARDMIRHIEVDGKEGQENIDELINQL